MTLPDRHLDLGCGSAPRNPYGRSRLCGIDIRRPEGEVHHEHRVANLVVEPIPYPDDSFASVSAFDFIEHLQPDRRMYGFRGRFEVVCVVRTERSSAYGAAAGSGANHPPLKRAARTVRRWVRWLRWLRGKRANAAPAYLLWELEAVK